MKLIFPVETAWSWWSFPLCQRKGSAGFLDQFYGLFATPGCYRKGEPWSQEFGLWIAVTLTPRKNSWEGPLPWGKLEPFLAVWGLSAHANKRIWNKRSRKFRVREWQNGASHVAMGLFLFYFCWNCSVKLRQGKTPTFQSPSIPRHCHCGLSSSELLNDRAGIAPCEYKLSFCCRSGEWKKPIRE